MSIIPPGLFKLPTKAERQAINAVTNAVRKELASPAKEQVAEFAKQLSKAGLPADRVNQSLLIRNHIRPTLAGVAGLGILGGGLTGLPSLIQNVGLFIFGSGSLLGIKDAFQHQKTYAQIVKKMEQIAKIKSLGG